MIRSIQKDKLDGENVLGFFLFFYNLLVGKATLQVSPWRMEKKIKAVVHVSIAKQRKYALQNLSMSGFLSVQQNRRIHKTI